MDWPIVRVGGRWTWKVKAKLAKMFKIKATIQGRDN
jgi:hypothetical protein